LEPKKIMSLTQTQIDLVKGSFVQVEPIADTAAALFYNRLFELDPNLRPLFKRDITEQGRMLMQMIAIAVRGLDHLDTLVPAVKALGQRHTGYGVKANDYNTVGAAFLWTLEQGLGAAFTPHVRDAWTAVYTVLAETAQSGAQAA
jgi:hemoglobin-like flavoprotein